MLDDIGRCGDGRVIARGIETCHGRWQRRLLDDLLNYFAMFCFVANIIVTYVCALLNPPPHPTNAKTLIVFSIPQWRSLLLDMAIRPYISKFLNG